MKITESLSKCLRKYTTFKGRAPRSEFWWFFLLWFLFAWPLLLTNAESDTALIYRLLSLIYFLLTLATTLPFLAVMSRRLHDVNRSKGWILLLFIAAIAARLFVATTCSGLAGTCGIEEYNITFGKGIPFFEIVVYPIFLIVFFVCISILFFMLIPKGNKGPNRFGDPDNEPFTPSGIRTKIPRSQLRAEREAFEKAQEEVGASV